MDMLDYSSKNKGFSGFSGMRSLKTFHIEISEMIRSQTKSKFIRDSSGEGSHVIHLVSFANRTYNHLKTCFLCVIVCKQKTLDCILVCKYVRKTKIYFERKNQSQNTRNDTTLDIIESSNSNYT